jgi:hypothetical protein
MTQDKGDPFFSAEVGQPLPREDTLYASDQIVPLGRADAQTCFRGRGQILVDPDRAALLEDTDVHGAGR